MKFEVNNSLISHLEPPPMAALLPPQPFPDIRKPAFSISTPKHSSQRLCAFRSSSTMCSSGPLNAPAKDTWSFEQRMREAFNVLDAMHSQGMEPDPALFCTLLQSCANAQNLEIGKAVHAKIRGSTVEEDAFLANNLIFMYAKCGDLRAARTLFDEMPQRNTVSWTTVISMYNQFGRPKEALRLYGQMKLARDVKPNGFTFATVLDACAKVRDWRMAQEIHEDIVREGCEGDEFVITGLIDVYAKCGKIDDARKMFDKMADPTIEACTAMIVGCNSNNRGKDAMDIIRRLFQSRININVMNELGLGCMIRSCIAEFALKQGQEIHCLTIKYGCKMETRTISSLVALYVECNKMGSARQLFTDLAVKDARLWGQMVAGYVRNGLAREALQVCSQMVRDDVGPDPFLLLQILDACHSLLSLEEGKQIHGWLVKYGSGLYNTCAVGNLVKMYSKFGEFEVAKELTKRQCKEALKAHVPHGC